MGDITLRKMKSAAFQHEHNGEFYRLLLAVLHEPEKVPAIVKERYSGVSVSELILARLRAAEAQREGRI